jgi:hypothetical protein
MILNAWLILLDFAFLGQVFPNIQNKFPNSLFLNFEMFLQKSILDLALKNQLQENKMTRFKIWVHIIRQ